MEQGDKETPGRLGRLVQKGIREIKGTRAPPENQEYPEYLENQYPVSLELKELMVQLGRWEAQEQRETRETPETPEKQERPEPQDQVDPLETMVIMGAQELPERRDPLDTQELLEGTAKLH